VPPFIAWVLARAGLCPEAYRSETLQRRVSACLRLLRVTSDDSARELVERSPELLPGVLCTALIGVSEFFRDRPVFEHLENALLPELLATRRGLRVCGVGVSGGQEIYSMAMLLAEAGALADSTLLGIDCRTNAVRKAQSGLFTPAEMTGVDEMRRERFFRWAGDSWEVSSVLKARIRWVARDVLQMQPGESWDLMLFRNVSIYLTPAHSNKAWSLVCDQVAPGGFLITGKVEKPPGFLPLMRVAPSIYKKE